MVRSKSVLVLFFAVLNHATDVVSKMLTKIARKYKGGSSEYVRHIGFMILPMGAFVMFVSHQWNGFAHPDPNGVQLECLVKVFRRLRDGKIDRVETDPFHTILYKTNQVTLKEELMKLFSNAYLWYDFQSQPQPRWPRMKVKFRHCNKTCPMPLHPCQRMCRTSRLSRDSCTCVRA